MRTRSLLILALGLLIAADSRKDALKKDKERLQGIWVIASVEVEGQDVTEALSKIVLPKDTFLHFKGDAMWMQNIIPGDVEGSFKLDAGSTPRTIDIKVQDNLVTKRPLTVEAIYEVSDNTLKLCVALKALEKEVVKERPTEVKTKAGSNTALFVFNRKKGK